MGIINQLITSLTFCLFINVKGVSGRTFRWPPWPPWPYLWLVQVTSRWGLSQSLLAMISESAAAHGCHMALVKILELTLLPVAQWPSGVPGRHHQVRCPCANGQHPGTQRALGQPPAPQRTPVTPVTPVTRARGTFKQGTEQVSLLANGVPSECLDAQIDQIEDGF